MHTMHANGWITSSISAFWWPSQSQQIRPHQAFDGLAFEVGHPVSVLRRKILRVSQGRAYDAFSSTKITIAMLNSTTPVISMRLTFSRNISTETRKVKISSIWPNART